MTEMNGFTLEGKRLVVKKADVGKDVDGAASVYVAGFEPRVGIARDLRRLFSEYGAVLDVTLMNPQEGKKGVAFVKFARYADAIAAVEKVKEFRRQELVVKIASQTARRATNWQRQAKDYDDTVMLAQHTCVPQSDRNVLVLYHYPSADGILAALAAHLYLKNYHPELAPRDVTIIPHPVYRPSPAPDKLPINRRMTDVFLLGYAGSPEYVQQLAHECNSVTILDHHAAARECFAALQEARALPPSVEVVVDGDRSAATLAWDYFTDKAGGSLLGPNSTDSQLQKLRHLFDYSEDHALGRHSLLNSRACTYALQKENLNYNVLENNGIWNVLQGLNVGDLIAKGEALLKDQDENLDTIVGRSFVIQIRDPHDAAHGHFGQCLAVLTDHPKDIGEMSYRLAVKSAESGLRAIGAVAFQKLGDATCRVNLRAVNNTDEDTLQIAEAFDASSFPKNHPGSSMFYVPLEVFQSWVVAQTPAPSMPRNLSYTANQLSLQYRVSRPEVYDTVKVDVTPAYFQVALGTTQAFDANTPLPLVQNMRQMGFQHCPHVAAAIFPVHVHRDVLCLLPRTHSPEHVYLWMVFMGLLRHLDPTATRLHSLVLCSTIPLAQHVYMVAQAYAKGTGARISSVCEPLSKDAASSMLDCHILITTPNTASMLCHEGWVNLAFLKSVMIHDADHILHMFLKHHLVDVLARIWAVRKRSGVTVGMYSTGSHRLVRQFAAELMEQDSDQHVTVTVTDPNESVAVPAPTVQAAAAVDGDRGFSARGLLEQMQRKQQEAPLGKQLLMQLQQGGGKPSQFSGQVSSIFSMAKQPAPQGTKFSGNVQSILSQLHASPASGSLGGLQPLVMQAGSTLPPSMLHPVAAEAPLPMVPVGFPTISYGKGMAGVPFTMVADGDVPQGPPLRDIGYGKGGPAVGFGGKGAGKGAKGGGKGGFAGPPPPAGKGSSDGMPRSAGQASPVYPWHRPN
eukprot:GGOE01001312.1.p1 GENE.GGOE01001312.1~~GGOE01001312.1.p1  ORF type:complete len:1046 (+),score=239.19 GGOE01001312.1:247-3138(+)